MAFLLSPIGNSQLVDVNGNPLSGGTIETYIAGTSTPSTTFTNNQGNIPQANPIALTVLGLPPQPIWLDSLLSYKFIIKDANGVVQGPTWDNIQGISGATAPPADQWVIYTGGAPTFLSSTSFSLTGDQTSIFQVGRRVRTVNTSGIVYSTILTSVFTTLTTITLANDSGVLDAGISQVAYGILSPQNTSVPNTVALSSYLAFTGVAELTTTGTSPNYILSSALPLTSYQAGQRLRVKFHAAGNVNPLTNYTLNVNGLGAINIFAYGTGGGFIPPITVGIVYDMEYDGSNFIVLTPISGSSRVGEIIDWAGNYTPSYALLCNGAAVSRSTYCRLFARIGVGFGAGDGTTTFNLPNFPVGYTTANSNGSNVGTSTVGDNLAHTHTTTFYGTSGSGTAPSEGGTPVGPNNVASNSTGSSANFPAALYMRKCIIF